MTEAVTQIFKWVISFFLLAQSSHCLSSQYEFAPQKPVRIIVGFSVGSSPDLIARSIAPILEKKFNQPVYVENHTGGSGISALELVSKAPADGQTILMATASMFVINPEIFTTDSTLIEKRYKLLNSLKPVAALANIQYYLVANSKAQFQDFKSFINFAKMHPNQLNFGSSGVGTLPHIGVAIFNKRMEIDVQHIPYQGSGQILNALLAGQIDYYLDPGIALSFVKAGKLRLLAIDAPKRNPEFPETPTLNELGIRDFTFSSPQGFFIRKDTPDSITKSIHQTVNAAIKDKTYRTFIENMGHRTHPKSITQFQQELNLQKRIINKEIKELKITPNS